MKGPLDRAEALLRKAEHDLRVANLSVGDPDLADAVCFHAQQAAEKSLKAVLAAHDVVYRWTHDLQVLVELAWPLVPELADGADDIASLTVYAVEVRYDSEVADPNQADAREALNIAERLFELAWRDVAPNAGPRDAVGRAQQ